MERILYNKVLAARKFIAEFEESMEWFKKIADTLDRERFRYQGDWGAKYHPTVVEITAEFLIDQGHLYLDKDEECGFSFDFYEDDYFTMEDFWYHFQIVTGRIVKKDKQQYFFRCAC